MIRKHHVAAQQGTANGAVVTSISQMWIVFTRGAVNGPTVKLKTFSSMILGNYKWQMIHAIAFPQNTMKQRNESGMRENGLKDGRVAGCTPLQDTTQIFASRTRAVQGTITNGIAQRGIAALHHVLLTRINGRVGGGDLFRRQDVADNQISIQVKQVTLVVGHFGGIGFDWLWR